MNKKFSTLVAALLVTGGSFAMVSQYAGTALAESPLAMAAAANLRATGADEAAPAKAAIALESYAATSTKWTVTSVRGGGFTLNSGLFYLLADGTTTQAADEADVFTADGYALQYDGEAVKLGEEELAIYGADGQVISSTPTTGEVYVGALPEAGQFEDGKSFVTGNAYEPIALGTATHTDALSSDLTVFTVEVVDGKAYLAQGTGDDKVYISLNEDKNEIIFTSEKKSDVINQAHDSEQLILFNGTSLYIKIKNGKVVPEAGYDDNCVRPWTYESSAAAVSSWVNNGAVYLSTTGIADGVGVKITAAVPAATAASTEALSGDESVWVAESAGDDFKLYLNGSANSYLAVSGGKVLPVAEAGNAAVFTQDVQGRLKSNGEYLTLDGDDLKLGTDATKALTIYTVNALNKATAADAVEGTAYMIGEYVAPGTIDQSLNITGITPANLVDGDTYMVQNGTFAMGMYVTDAGKYALGVSSAFNGQATTLRATSVTMINEVLWKVSKDESTGTPLYSFTNVQTGKPLAFKKNASDEYVFDAEGTITKFSLVGNSLVFNAGGRTYYVNVQNSGVTVTTGVAEVVFAEPDELPVGPSGTFDVDDAINKLNNEYGMGSGFSVLLKNKALSEKDVKDMVVESNPFTDYEVITAVKGPDMSLIRTKTGADGDVTVTGKNLSGYMFLRVAGSYKYDATASTVDKQKAQRDAFRASTFIAVDTVRYSKYVEDVTGNNFFSFKTVSGAEMLNAAAQTFEGTATTEDYKRYGKLNGITRHIENAAFEISQTAGATAADPIKIYAPDAYVPAADNGEAIALNGHTSYGDDLYISIKEFTKKNYVGAYADSWDYIYIGLQNDVDYKTINGIVTLTSRKYDHDGEVLATDEDGVGVAPVLAKYVATDKPEGQFLVQGGYTENGVFQGFTFTNRESGEMYNNGTPVTLKSIKGKANMYAVSNSDTLEIKAASTADEFDGYANYKKSVLDNTEYVLKVVSNAAGIQDIYIAEDHNKDHSLGLNADTLEAATFKLVKFESKADYAKYKDHGDTVFVSTKPYSYVAVDKKTKEEYYGEAYDRVVAFTYVIYNADNNEFLSVSEKNQGSTLKNFFYCDPNLKYDGSADTNNKALRFIIKEKNNGAIQLIPVDVDNSNFLPDEDTPTTPREVVFYDYNDATRENNGIADLKLYAGISDNKLYAKNTIYTIADNDLFTIQQIGTPQYRALEAAAYDTVRIYKEGAQNVALFAESADAKIVSGKNFLGMEHKADADLNKTMFSFMVDTAYVDRADNLEPQYLLAIDAEVVPSVKYCDEHGIDPECNHTKQTIAYMKGSYLVNLADSAAAWAASKAHNNPYTWNNQTRLGFVKATHIQDKLIIERGAPVKADTIDLTQGNKAAFSLRIVDQDTKAFALENNGAYVKWLNGVPVMVNALAEAEVLNLESTENNPTANESIAAEGVQVIAGKGVVTVQGAAGKVVTVANILGQTIANQVAASDNVTIAAPAGVLVVTVDGEATKVVVK